MGTSHAPADVRTLPVGRAFFADERGVVLRTTWYLDRGFLNMSIWQDRLCVATFQLKVTDAARLATFLVEGLGDATETLLRQREQLGLRAVPEPPAATQTVTEPSGATRSVTAAAAARVRAAWTALTR